MKRGFVGAAIAIALLAACTFLDPLGTDLTGGAPEDAGSDALIAAEVSVADTGAGGDAGDDAPSEAAAPCTSGQIVKGVTASDATPVSGAPVCNPLKILVDDSAFAGLDRSGSAAKQVDGEDVTSCIAVDLGADTALSDVVFKGSASGDACGFACFDAGAGDGCGTGHSAALFYAVAAAKDVWHLVGEVNIDAVPKTYTLPMPDAAPPVRYLVVCRLSWGLERDDVGADFLGGRCK